MRSRSLNKILIAFILNLAFSCFELLGGLLIGSVAILSDAVHDFGDAVSIGLSYFLEKKSKKRPNENYTYGYARYSILGSALTTLILIIGSLIIISHAIERLISPIKIDYNGMLILAIIGVVVNTAAAIATKDGDSMNQRAVNLHMLEDVLGWIVVLIGSIIMRFTDLIWIDAVLSIIVAIFMLVSASLHLIKTIRVLMDESPIVINDLKTKLLEIDGIIDVHHIHIWSSDGNINYATMHVVTSANHKEIKQKIRESLKEFGIKHSTIELESKWECCDNKTCDIDVKIECNCCHHHN